MQTVTVDNFRGNLREHVEKLTAEHEPLKVTRGDGPDFVVVSAEDWEREQETLYILQDPSLAAQIARSTATHAAGAGYRPPTALMAEDLDEIDRL